MSHLHNKKVLFWCLFIITLPFPLTSIAEGIIDIKPYIGSSIQYDDNIFRFSTSSQAKAAIGSTTTSDVVKRVEFGADVNLRLSRQLISLSSSLSQSKFNRFTDLNNNGKSNSLRWDWRLGNQFYGELSASKIEAIAGFSETRSTLKNLRTTDRKFASFNWDFKPDWTIYASRAQIKLDNAAENSQALNREDKMTEAGVRFQSQLNTQLALAYRVVDSTFPNRSGPIALFFGDASSQKEAIVTAAWLPGAKTRISTRLSYVNLERNITTGRDFSGFSQRLSLDYQATDKVNLNLAAYQIVAPVDDVVSTYVKSKGVDISPTWNMTSKVSLSGNLSYAQSTYLGSAILGNSGFAINTDERVDTSKLAGLSMIYAPTQKLITQLQYQGERRTSNLEGQSYDFNSINFLVRYNF